MAKLGGIFLTAAQGPIAYAGQCLHSRRVGDGLNELAGKNLAEAVDRGMQAVADAAGVDKADVAALLPMAQMKTVAGELATHHRVAVAEWQVHTQHAGGLLDGVADLTVDGRPADVCLGLIRLAEKMHRDKALAIPLRSLAEALERWQQLLVTCRVTIDDGAALKNAYRSRQVVRWGIAAVVILVVGTVGAVLATTKLAAMRLDEKLATLESDVCAVEKMTADDVSDANADQLGRIEAARAGCADKRERERLAAEAEQREREEREAQERARRARVEACERAASAITDGQPNADLEGLEQSELIQRLARDDLEASDLALSSFPCTDTKAISVIQGAYARIAVRDAGEWVHDKPLSDVSAKAIADGHASIPPLTAQIFSRVVDDLAGKAVTMGDPTKLERAVMLCRLLEAMATPGYKNCEAALLLVSD